MVSDDAATQRMIYAIKPLISERSVSGKYTYISAVNLT